MTQFHYFVLIFCITFGNQRALIKGSVCHHHEAVFLEKDGHSQNSNVSTFLCIRTSWNLCWPRSIRYLQLQPQAGRKILSKSVNQEKSTGSSQVSPNTKWYSEWRCQDLSVFCKLIFVIMLHLLHSGWREKLSCFSRLDNYFSLIPCARPNLSPQ